MYCYQLLSTLLENIPALGASLFFQTILLSESRNPAVCSFEQACLIKTIELLMQIIGEEERLDVLLTRPGWEPILRARKPVAVKILPELREYYKENK